MGGYIIQMQNFSVNDGEGIRTVIFMAGCPLHCEWCANPEGLNQKNPMTHWAETEEIASAIGRQAIFYRFSGGGVTFSGGEATAQPDFLRELTDLFYDEGYNLAIETCGQFNFNTLKPILKKMNLIFMDLKHIDPKKHLRYTGADNSLILKNIERTARLGVPMVVRIPVIVGVNADEKSIRGAFAFLRDHAPSASLELLPYHRYGESKYDTLGLTRPNSHFEIPSEEKMQTLRDLACRYGLKVVSYK